MKRMTFKRSLDSLEEIFQFTSGFFASQRVDPGLLPAVDLIVEELFTNVVEHSTGEGGDVPIEMEVVSDGVEVSLTDQPVDPFDITQVPEVDVSRPLEERDERGLGLHLVRQFADSVEYQYEYRNRCSRIIFRKTGSGGPESTEPGSEEKRDVRD
ncbi:MAG: ATP-binding protein [Wenzhouxiangellaceae bacterium]